MSKKAFSLADFASTKAKENIKQPDTTKSKESFSFDPETIVLDLGAKIDIPKIHDKISKGFSEAQSRLSSLQEQLLKVLQAESKTVEEKLMAQTQQRLIDSEILRLREKMDESIEYTEGVSELLKVYDEIVPKNTGHVIGTSDIQVSSEHHHLFQIIVSDFVNLVKRFAENVVILDTTRTVDNCPKCNGIPLINGTKAECMSCGHVISLNSGENGLSNSTSGKSDYYRSETFDVYIAVVQGRGKVPVPPEVYQTIDEHCESYRISTETLTKNDIRNILSKYGLTDWYASVNLIANKLTGSKLIDIRKYEERLRVRHGIFEKEFLAIRDEEGRRNFLQNWYVLLIFLMMEDFNPKIDDFVVPVTREALLNHDRIARKICEKIKSRQSPEEAKQMNWNFNGIA